ncbi:hypothetical protein [Synechocystis sp. PCC 7338]|nr:hypothetical protein [Synechocystis sp. PCC 7338]QUS61722.1 hypothetical protein HTZ78_14335 [Synechocystis sp. PCC 7338]
MSPWRKRSFSPWQVDFLIFHQGKCVILQIDGPQHKDKKARDYAGDRLVLSFNCLVKRRPIADA